MLISRKDKPLPEQPGLVSARQYPKLSREASSASLSETPLLGSSINHDSAEDESGLNTSLGVDGLGRKPDDGHVSSLSSNTASPFGDEHIARLEGSGHLKSNVPPPFKHVLAVIEAMKQDPEWRAVRYSLLSKNCNHFTSELCLRLTGKPAPAWISESVQIRK